MTMTISDTSTANTASSVTADISLDSRLNIRSSTSRQATGEKAPAKKKAPDGAGYDKKQQVRVMNHVVQTYNLHGKVRTKFMDSNNNVIYQIPAEMVAKTEDLMKTEPAANTEG